MPSARTHSVAMPDRAMILAAGLGSRMRPLTDDRPKPLVRLMGRPLIDHLLDEFTEARISKLVVNLHYCADLLETHLRQHHGFDIRFSDERDALLDTGGGVRQALPLLGLSPFFILNTDSLWAGTRISPLKLLAQSWRDEDMDCLLLLARCEGAIGYDGVGDFYLQDDGRVLRRGSSPSVEYAHTGVCLIHPRLFAGSPEGAFSMNLIWDRALANRRLFGAELTGQWMHIGDPAAIREAETWLSAGQS